MQSELVASIWAGLTKSPPHLVAWEGTAEEDEMATHDRVFADQLQALRLALGICTFALKADALAPTEREVFEALQDDLVTHGQKIERLIADNHLPHATRPPATRLNPAP